MTDSCKSDLIFEADDDLIDALEEMIDLIDALEEMIDKIGERLKEGD